MANISLKAEKSQKTRRALLDVAQELFTKQGYANTSTEEIVSRAEVTRGALYYHFHDKAALFKAVFDEVRFAYVQTIRERIQAAEGDTWQRVIVTGCQAFIENTANPSVERIVYIDGPAVLDRSAIQEHAPGLMFLRNVFEQLMAEGLIEQMPVEPLVRLLWATFFEAAVYIAHADNGATARKEMADVLMHVLTGLRPAHARALVAGAGGGLGFA